MFFFVFEIFHILCTSDSDMDDLSYFFTEDTGIMTDLDINQIVSSYTLVAGF